jgi:Flp pilus assembly protein protease CpaA
MYAPVPSSHLFFLLILALASYYDIRRRLIPRWLNTGVILLILAYTIAYLLQSPESAVYVTLVLAAPSLLWRINLIGGADAKLLALASLVLADPSNPSLVLPVMLISISYALVFLTPDMRTLRLGWKWLLPMIVLTWTLSPGMVLPVILAILLTAKSVEMSTAGYSETLPLEDLQSHHLVREAIKDGEIVEVSDIDMLLWRKKYDYMPPPLLEEREIEKIKNIWREKGKTEIKVSREKPGIPAMLAAILLYNFIYY